MEPEAAQPTLRFTPPVWPSLCASSPKLWVLNPYDVGLAGNAVAMYSLYRLENLSL